MAFDAAIDLSTLNGTNGFRIDGVGAGDRTGSSVASAGDVNGDGFDDVIIGAPFATAGGDDYAGKVYVVFGKANGFSASFDLASLNGSNGFRLDGIDMDDNSGRSVSSAGDINGDGFDDIIFGVDRGNVGSNTQAGETYVVFGKASGFTASIDLASLNGSNGFRIDGVDPNDRSGFSVAAAGDVNGDNIDDVIIGAFGANGFVGESYVVFGTTTGFSASFDLGSLNGSNGFRIDGIDANDRSGISVASAGDVNGDGFDDIIVAAYGADPGGDSYAGESYVIFGKGTGFAASFDPSTLNGSNGFRLDGLDAYDYSGRSVASAGDVNGDGFDDIIIGAYGGDPGGDSYAGETYVVFGSNSGFSASLDLGSLNGSNGFRIDGINLLDRSGRSVASAGDVNGDGFADLIIGAAGADPGGDSGAGASYIVFGKASGFAANLDLASLNGSNGFRLDGIDGLDGAGASVASAGDINGDGYDDIIVGAPSGDPGGVINAGETYVIFGRTSNQTEGTAGADSLTGADGNDVLNGYAGNDILIGRKREDVLNGGDNDDRLYGGNGLDTLNGDGGNDRLFGMNDDDTLNGGAGDDRIVGGNGDDTITGGAGRDVLTGGAGSDTFVYTDALDSVAGATRDVINDFEHGVDTIDLSALDAIPGGGDDPFVIVSAFSGTAGEIRLFNNATGSSAAIDIDGDGVADMSIFVKSDAPLEASDFVL